MANEVNININGPVTVKHSDIEVEIKRGGSKLGKLLISKGNIEWLPKGNYVNKRRMRWDRFADFMETYGKPVKSKS